jgi:hypothetical protein
MLEVDMPSAAVDSAEPATAVSAAVSPVSGLPA